MVALRMNLYQEVVLSSKDVGEPCYTRSMLVTCDEL